VPTLLPAPILFEPENGARFPDKVRFKWIWNRRLGEDEKFALRLASIAGPEVFEWWVSEGGLLDGGGAIHPMPAQTIVSEGKVYQVGDSFRFEINAGVRPLPPGAALWSVAVVGERPEKKWQISQRSEERLIYKVP
jgi:hypothetical protein